MASNTTLSVPIIDFSNLDLNEPGNSEWESVKLQVFEAIEDYGCFRVLLKKVSLELQKSVMKAVKELFDLPLETKMRNNSPIFAGGGFTRKMPLAPLYESISINDPTSLQTVDGWTQVFWPQGNPIFRNSVHKFSQPVSELDKLVRRMIVESLGLDKYMEEHISSSHHTLRLIKYEAPNNGEAELGLLPHRDQNLITILFQNHVDGLEIQTKDGEWIDVELSSPDTFIVLIGQSFHAWTNGRIQGPYHQVKMRGNEERYSIGMFSSFSKGYIVKAPEELVDEEHPLRYKPFDFLEFVAYHKSNGLSPKSPLRQYCGV